jgi:hypothetical protein
MAYLLWFVTLLPLASSQPEVHVTDCVFDFPFVRQLHVKTTQAIVENYYSMGQRLVISGPPEHSCDCWHGWPIEKPTHMTYQRVHGGLGP